MLRMFESSKLSRVCCSTREKLIGALRKLRSEEFRNLYLSRNIIIPNKRNRMKWAGMQHEREGSAYTILVVKYVDMKILLPR
jgi:hypothetical protein